ncbi:hypothetical protein LNK15_14565, partial [Jeotgalicoccus huakuii]|nr:hypothetical protein [Jeotgalicoccus huakuii]
LLIPSASADVVTLWERLDTGDVIAMTRQPTTEEMKNLKLHVHTFGGWVISEPATCSDTGLKYQTCIRCGYVNSEKIPKLPHS